MNHAELVGPVVGFDTATALTAAAVLLPDGRSWSRRDAPQPDDRPAHASRLLELVQGALEDSGLDWDAIARLGVGVGPGGFTGMRIGVATGQGLSLARGLPVVPVGSTATLLAAARADRGPHAPGSGERLVAVVDARRGEVFATDEGRPSEVGTLTPDALAARLSRVEGAPAHTVAVGDGAVRHRGVLEAAGISVPPDASHLHRIDPVWTCRLAAAGTPVPSAQLLPDYRREADAKVPAAAAGALGPA